MILGSAKIWIRLPDNSDLKGKRRVTQSVCTMIKDRFNVSICEADALEDHKILVLGVVCVSTSAKHASKIVASVLAYLETTRRDVQIIDSDVEIISGV